MKGICYVKLSKGRSGKIRVFFYLDDVNYSEKVTFDF